MTATLNSGTNSSLQIDDLITPPSNPSSGISLYSSSGVLNFKNSSGATYIALGSGGTNASLTASNGGIVWSNASQMQILSGTSTAGQFVLSGSNSAPFFSNIVNNISTFANVTDASSTSSGSLITNGGLGVAKSIWCNAIGGAATGIAGRTDSGTPSSGQIGELVSANTVSITLVSGSWQGSSTPLFSLPNAGVWMLFVGAIGSYINGVNVGVQFQLSPISGNTSNSGILANCYGASIASLNNSSNFVVSFSGYYVATGAASIYIQGFGFNTTQTITFQTNAGAGYSCYAVRIA